MVQTEPGECISQVVLRSPLRQYFIDKVKAPLRKVIILIAKRIPNVTKENTRYRNTYTLIDIFDRFFEHERNAGREGMFRAVFKIFLFEIEHDVYYRDRFNWFLEEIIKVILRGEWEERTNGYPNKPWWIETEPYGGKYSIIRKITTLKE